VSSKAGEVQFRSYHVKVDGHDVGEVRRGELRVFTLMPGPHEVHLEIDWARGPSISVDAILGETVQLVCYPRFHAWQAKRALANPGEWIVMTTDETGDG